MKSAWPFCEAMSVSSPSNGYYTPSHGSPLRTWPSHGTWHPRVVHSSPWHSNDIPWRSNGGSKKVPWQARSRAICHDSRAEVPWHPMATSWQTHGSPTVVKQSRYHLMAVSSQSHRSPIAVPRQSYGIPWSSRAVLAVP